MANIKVLSATAGSTESRTAAPGALEEKTTQSGGDFAAVMSAWLATLGLGGQNSPDNFLASVPVKGAEVPNQTANEQAVVLAAMLSALGPRLLGADLAGRSPGSDFPAGKEANSGTVDWVAAWGLSARQGVSDALNLGWASRGETESGASQVTAVPGRTGMIMPGQGQSPGILTELDKDIIQQLLQKLSGQIKPSTDFAPGAKGIFTELGPVSGQNQNRDWGQQLPGGRPEIVFEPKDATISASESLDGGTGRKSESLPQSQALTEGHVPEVALGNKPESQPGSQALGRPVGQAGSQPEIQPGSQALGRPVNQTPSLPPQDGQAVNKNPVQAVAQEQVQDRQAQSSSDPSPDQANQVLSSVKLNGSFSLGQVSPPKADTTPVWQQIASAMLGQLALHDTADARRSLIKQLEIQLHPAELGKIEIALHWDNGVLHLQVHAAEPGTGTMLQNHFADLRQSLTNAGITCGTLQMDLNSDGRRQPYPGWQQEFSGRQRDEREPVMASVYTPGHSPVLGWEPSSLGSYRLNVTA